MTAATRLGRDDDCSAECAAAVMRSALRGPRPAWRVRVELASQAKRRSRYSSSTQHDKRDKAGERGRNWHRVHFAW